MTEMTSDALPSWRALFGEEETVHRAITSEHTQYSPVLISFFAI